MHPEGSRVRDTAFREIHTGFREMHTGFRNQREERKQREGCSEAREKEQVEAERERGGKKRLQQDGGTSGQAAPPCRATWVYQGGGG